MSYMLCYFDGCTGTSQVMQYNTKEELHAAVKEVLASDTTSEIEIYECKRLKWDIVIEEKK